MSYITDKTTELLDFAREQESSMLTESKSLAVAIASAPDPSLAAQELFDVIRGAYAYEKTLGHKRETSEISAAWNRIKSAMRHHLKAENLSVTFPDIRTGEGETVVQTAAESKDERAAKKEEQNKRDNEARAQHIAKESEKERKAIRDMDYAQVAQAMLSIFDVWNYERPDTERALLVELLTRSVAPKVELPAVPELTPAKKAPAKKAPATKKAA